jgi:LEA14-like dessication related protein
VKTAPLAALAALLALSLSGCSFLRSLAAGGFDEPSLEYQSWSAESLDAEGVTIALQYLVKNPNARGFKLSRAAWALELEGKPAAQGDMPAGLDVPAKGSAPFVLPVRLRWRDIPDLVTLVATRRDVGFKVSGTAALSSPLGDVGIPFSKSGRVDVPRPPGISIRGVNLRELSLTSLSFDVDLQLTNGNRFPLPVGALAYGLRLGNEPLATGGERPLAAVPAGGTATVKIPVRLSLASAGSAIRRLVNGDSVPVEVEGNAGFGDLRFPFEAEGEVEKESPPQSRRMK